MTRPPPLPHWSFGNDGEVDFVIVGAGVAGGVLAAELARDGFEVVVLEQGPWRTARDFDHDEVGDRILGTLTRDPRGDPQTFRSDPSEDAENDASPRPLNSRQAFIFRLPPPSGRAPGLT
jgi:choline dehydrogenase-like flavoprotein